MKKGITIFLGWVFASAAMAQVKWEQVDSLFGNLPSSFHVFKTTSSLDGKPNITWYVEADLKDKGLQFTTDTTYRRRLKPSAFYEKNDKPLLVVNGTFFSFTTNRSLNIVVKDGKLLSPNSRIVKGRGKDSTLVYMPHLSAIGIDKKRNADIAWIKADTLSPDIRATQKPPQSRKNRQKTRDGIEKDTDTNKFSRWNMETAIGGGPVLVQDGTIKITSEQEMMFTGRGMTDKHPRTAMGYRKDGKLIILVIEGRNPGTAEGATLLQTAQLFKDLGCIEALNLDGGGSSCMLVNGKETIRVSDAGGQRPVPAVFIIKQVR